MMNQNPSSGPKATLLKPMEEYTEYVEFCKTAGFDPIGEAEFYKGAYVLALRGLVAGFEKDGIASFQMGDTTLLLCEVEKDGLVLSLFKTAELQKYEDKETAAKALESPAKAQEGPTDHLG